MAEKWTPPEGTHPEDAERVERLTRISRNLVFAARDRLSAAMVAQDPEWELAKWRARVNALILEAAENVRILR